MIHESEAKMESEGKIRWADSWLPSRTYTLKVPTEMNVDIDNLPPTRTV
jgi:hypothetical protein